MTLCFTQEQAATVYAATMGDERGTVFISPFVGRLNDHSENGMDIIKNIVEMFKKGDRPVMILAASMRNLEHFLYGIALGSDIITAPFHILKEWGKKNPPLPSKSFNYKRADLKLILYKEIYLTQQWGYFDINHELTDLGIKKFAEDWNALIKKNNQNVFFVCEMPLLRH